MEYSGKEGGRRFLKGAYDLHIHTGPDMIPRKLSDLTAVKRARAAGMAGIAIKSHVGSTAGRAGILNEMYPDFRTVSGLVLNETVGGLNPAAVRAFGKMGGDIVWMPTMDAVNFRKYKKEEGGISVLRLGGTLVEAAEQILDLIAQCDLTLATGHLGREEVLCLVQRACQKGIKKIWITHVTHPACALSISEQSVCAAMGAVIEHSYGHIYEGRCTLERSLEEIQAVGAEHVCLTTDTGQIKFPWPDQAFAEYIKLLSDAGITKEQIERMIIENPKQLIRKEREEQGI